MWPPINKEGGTMKLRVSSKPERFRRAGFAFTKEPQEIDVDQKTFDILKGEPMLNVEEVKETPTTLNVEKTVELVMAAKSIEALEEMAKSETRKGVLTAIEKRRAEIEAE